MVFSKIADLFKQPSAKKIMAFSGAILLLSSLGWAVWSYRKRAQRKASGTNLDPSKMSQGQATADTDALQQSLKARLASVDGNSILEADLLVDIQRLHIALNRSTYIEREIDLRRSRRKLLAEDPSKYFDFVQREIKDHPQELSDNMSGVLAKLGIDLKRYQTSVRYHIHEDSGFLDQFNQPLEEMFDFSSICPEQQQPTLDEAKKIYRRAIELLDEEDPECEPELLAEIKNVYVVDMLFEEFGIEEEVMNNIEQLEKQDPALADLVESYRSMTARLTEAYSPGC